MTDLPTAPTQRTGSLRAVLLLALVFCLGAAIGVGGGLIFLHRLAQRSFSSEAKENLVVEFLVFRLERQIATELGATPAEREAAHRELLVSMNEVTKLRAKLRRDARAIVADTVDRIEPLLSPDKRPKLRELAAKQLSPWGLEPK